MEAILEKTESGAILYDRSILNHISDAHFRPDGWHAATPVQGRLRSAGRGSTMIVSDGEREFVLRHYRRGGMVSRVNRDRYLWRGEKHTRAFSEWRLLARLIDMGLAVPRPAAARYQRSGLFYTADLLTVRVPGITPLSVRLAGEPVNEELWRRVGLGLRRFHDAGVFHADLNAYNVQLTADDNLFLLDFDRGELRPPGRWQQENLARLHRSLRKLKRLDPALHFSEADWHAAMNAYRMPQPA
ncbi:MAG TPA: 3-deoxy-D-manno-octulosonic acid kinase [Woeseiaceae bacterium]|nr:3-deoxy-D-manno-octulosonic acid kinase [Woeseiaceae bacterium]